MPRRAGGERDRRCRGNYQSAWFSSGGYDFVAEAVFGGFKADGLFLEYDDERAKLELITSVAEEVWG